jgi:hypothetical protein
MMTNRNTEEALLVEANVLNFWFWKAVLYVGNAVDAWEVRAAYLRLRHLFRRILKKCWKNPRNPDEPNRKPNENFGKVDNLKMNSSSETVYGPHFLSLFTVDRSQTHQNTRGTHASPTFSPKKLEWVCESPFGVYKNIPSGCGGGCGCVCGDLELR